VRLTRSVDAYATILKVVRKKTIRQRCRIRCGSIDVAVEAQEEDSVMPRDPTGIRTAHGSRRYEICFDTAPIGTKSTTQKGVNQ
jgi:hypothetical protein